MALFYATRSTPQNLGKFHHRRRPGVQHEERTCYREFRFELLSMQSSAPIHRLRYHVSIYNSRNLRVGFLRDFMSASQALASAKDWVDEHRHLGQR